MTFLLGDLIFREPTQGIVIPDPKINNITNKYKSECYYFNVYMKKWSVYLKLHNTLYIYFSIA